MKDLEKIRSLVGDITAEDVTYVDCAVSDTVGAFMPVAGQCQYATSPEHTHPAWSFIVSFDSRCRTRFGNTVYESVPSTVFVISPNDPHQEMPSDIVARYIAVLIDTPFLEKQLAAYKMSIDSLVSRSTCPASQRLIEALKEFMTDYEEAAPGYEQLLSAGSLKITHLLIRQLCDVHRGNNKFHYRMSVTSAIEFLNEHYGKAISVEDLARVANLSPSRFSRVFKEETTLSPMEYILQTRLDCAKRMLRGREKTLSQIALECGFNSSSYFCHCFTRAFNLSPSDYRKSITLAE